MVEENLTAKCANEKAIIIAVSVASVILICLFGALIIEFFVEKTNGGDALTNIGTILISMILALPTAAVLPMWIILLTKKRKHLFPIIVFTVALVMLLICFLLGWFYPD